MERSHNSTFQTLPSGYFSHSMVESAFGISFEDSVKTEFRRKKQHNNLTYKHVWVLKSPRDCYPQRGALNSGRMYELLLDAELDVGEVTEVQFRWNNHIIDPLRPK